MKLLRFILPIFLISSGVLFADEFTEVETQVAERFGVDLSENQTINEVNSQIDTIEERVDEVRSDFEGRVSDVSSEVQGLISDVSDRREELEDELEAKKAELEAELRKLQDDLRKLEDDYKAKVAELKDKWTGTKEKLNEALADLKEKFEEAKRKAQEAIDKAKQKIADTIAGIKSLVTGAITGAIDDVKEDFNKIAQTVESDVAAIQEGIEKELVPGLTFSTLSLMATGLTAPLIIPLCIDQTSTKVYTAGAAYYLVKELTSWKKFKGGVMLEMEKLRQKYPNLSEDTSIRGNLEEAVGWANDQADYLLAQLAILENAFVAIEEKSQNAKVAAFAYSAAAGLAAYETIRFDGGICKGWGSGGASVMPAPAIFDFFIPKAYAADQLQEETIQFLNTNLNQPVGELVTSIEGALGGKTNRANFIGDVDKIGVVAGGMISGTAAVLLMKGHFPKMKKMLKMGVTRSIMFGASAILAMATAAKLKKASEIINGRIASLRSIIKDVRGKLNTGGGFLFGFLDTIDTLANRYGITKSKNLSEYTIREIRDFIARVRGAINAAEGVVQAIKDRDLLGLAEAVKELEGLMNRSNSTDSTIVKEIVSNDQKRLLQNLKLEVKQAQEIAALWNTDTIKSSNLQQKVEEEPFWGKALDTLVDLLISQAQAKECIALRKKGMGVVDPNCACKSRNSCMQFPKVKVRAQGSKVFNDYLQYYKAMVDSTATGNLSNEAKFEKVVLRNGPVIMQAKSKVQKAVRKSLRKKGMRIDSFSAMENKFLSQQAEITKVVYNKNPKAFTPSISIEDSVDTKSKPKQMMKKMAKKIERSKNSGTTLYDYNTDSFIAKMDKKEYAALKRIKAKLERRVLSLGGVVSKIGLEGSEGLNLHDIHENEDISLFKIISRRYFLSGQHLYKKRRFRQ